MAFSISPWHHLQEVMEHWDVAVIGAGLAGSAAATELARAGKKVLLLEKENCSHHKVCGEFLSHEAMYYLGQLGLDLAKLGAQPIHSMRLIRGEKIVDARLPFAACSLSRYCLDENLLQLSITNGVDVRRGYAARELTHPTDVWHIKWSNDNCASANAVFLATGKHNLKGWLRAPGLQNNMIGFKMHFSPGERELEYMAGHVQILFFEGGYAGLVPLEGGLSNLCLVVKKSQFHKCKGVWAELLKHISSCSPWFAKFIRAAKACWKGPRSISGIPYGFIHGNDPHGSNGLYRLGDQMAVIPSFTGDGMSIALYTAHAAVYNYLKRDSQSYHLEVYPQLDAQVRRASRMLEWISSPFNQWIFHTACAVYPGLLSRLALSTRLEVFRKQ